MIATKECLQTKRVAHLLDAKSVDEITQEIEDLVTDEVCNLFKKIQNHLHVESGDQACYFIADHEERGLIKWLTSYALSEIQLYADEKHEDYDALREKWTCDGLASCVTNKTY